MRVIVIGRASFALVASLLVVAASVARLVKGRPWKQVLLEAAFAVYVALVIAMTLLPVQLLAPSREWLQAVIGRNGEPLYWRTSVNLVPLRTIRAQLSADAYWAALPQLAGNLALLFPLGVLAPALFARMRRLPAFALLTLLVILGIEALQLLERVTFVGWRSLDVDDLILNAAGALAGYALWRVGWSLLRRPKRSAHAEEEAAA